MDPIADQQPQELTLAEKIPSPPDLGQVLDTITGLPSEVIQIAHQLPDVLHMPQLDHDHEIGG
jgi:hypothetical protein